MNNLRVCIGSHFVFKGFTVQPGMLFGELPSGEAIVTNGNHFKDGYWIYIASGETFQRIHIIKESHPQLFVKIEKAIRQRERKQIGGVSYRTPLKLEHERWNKIGMENIFRQACVPVGHTPK